MRGKKVFDSVAPPDTDLFGKALAAPEKPGRNAALAERRNMKMAARLYYYRRFHPLVKNEAIMQLMTQDFDLSAVRIAEVLVTLDVPLQQLKVAKPDLHWFWERWPRMVWSVDKLEFDKYDDE